MSRRDFRDSVEEVEGLASAGPIALPRKKNFASVSPSWYGDSRELFGYWRGLALVVSPSSDVDEQPRHFLPSRIQEIAIELHAELERDAHGWMQ